MLLLCQMQKENLIDNDMFHTKKIENWRLLPLASIALIFVAFISY